MNRPNGKPLAMGGQIHPADPAYRRIMLVRLFIAGAAGIVGLAALYYGLDRLHATLGQSDFDAYQRWLSRIFAAIGLFFAASAAGFGFWLKRLAEATRRDRRWPPLTQRTTSDMRIRYLTSADSLVAQIMAGTWALFGLAALLTAWAIWQIVTV